MERKVTIYLKIRRFDLSDNPEFETKRLELSPKIDYPTLRQDFANLFHVNQCDRVIKIRNQNLCLVPLMDILQGNTIESPFIVDVTRIHQSQNASTNLQDAYLDAVRHKLHNIETRVTQAEMLIPQLQWRRQAHTEHTAYNLSTRVSFLSKRIDDLSPPDWKSKMPPTPGTTIS